jgi:hypothetical protein
MSFGNSAGRGAFRRNDDCANDVRNLLVVLRISSQWTPSD